LLADGKESARFAGKEAPMRNRSLLSAIALMAMAFPLLLRAQTAAPSRTDTAQSQGGSSKVADLSGDWAPDPKRGGIGQSLSLSDIGGRNRGKETDIPYQPWAREKTLSERTSTGPDPKFGDTTDPQVLYCEPPGVPHIYLWPIKTKFIHTPEAVYILHELGPYFRVVWLNSKHPDDPDPQWWGHSIGHYENGDTLVVDTVGFNDKTWLDQMGHPHGTATRSNGSVDQTTLELEMTIDDQGRIRSPGTRAGTSRCQRPASCAISRSARCVKTRGSTIISRSRR
jgi:hypothetical protein